MAKQFALDGAFGYCAAVNHRVAIVAAFAVAVYDLRKEFLTRTAFAYNEHREVERSHFQGSFDGAVQCRRIANNRKLLLNRHYRLIVALSHIVYSEELQIN